jgi:hypothetical protein
MRRPLATRKSWSTCCKSRSTLWIILNTANHSRSRGKKVTKRIEDSEPEESDDEQESFLNRLPEEERLKILAQKPMTRSSIKPRLLFPTEEQEDAREQKALRASQRSEEEVETEVDEEAITDIDDAHLQADDSEVENDHEQRDTPRALTRSDDMLKTPNHSDRDSFVTPSTGRATRSKDANSSPMSIDSAKRTASPFDNWRRIKKGGASSDSPKTSKKRRTETHLALPTAKGPKGGKKRRGSDVQRSGGTVTKKTRRVSSEAV